MLVVFVQEVAVHSQSDSYHTLIIPPSSGFHLLTQTGSYTDILGLKVYLHEGDEVRQTRVWPEMVKQKSNGVFGSGSRPAKIVHKKRRKKEIGCVLIVLLEPK